MKMAEAQARSIVLAQAIETTDTQGKLLGPQASVAIDRQSRHAARGATGPRAQQLQNMLAQRAVQVIEAVRPVQPALAALAEPPAWQRWLAAGLPLATFLLGALTDRISDPHRVDLLSQPLLAIVAWNIVVYAILLARWAAGLGQARAASPAPWTERLLRWADGLGRRRNARNLRSDVTAFFMLHWHAATAALAQQRVARVLHLAAAGWAAGVAASLLARGLFVQYRVGWESTWLSAEQVHAVLGLLFLPAVALFGFAPLTLQEVAALQVQATGGHAPERRWVLMVAALLLVMVIVPRLVLAAWAHWRERRLAPAVALDLHQPYFQHLAATLLPARVLLGVTGQSGEGVTALRRILLQEPRAGGGQLLIETGEGDALCLAGAGLQSPDFPVDLWLEVAVRPPARGAPVARPQGAPILTLEAAPHCWFEEPVLLQAISAALPAVLRPGMGRIAAAWEQRNRQRLGQSMSSLALQLLEAARETQEVRRPPVSVKQFLVAADRQAHEKARQAAMEQVAARLAQSAAVTGARLAQLHGVHEGFDYDRGDDLDDGYVDRQSPDRGHFLVQQNVNAPQAGIAGATTGAAMGASVDLITGGLTLGAAAALGALLGGGAAVAAAAWKNMTSDKAGAAGMAMLQPGDALLHALAQAGLLRYLGIIHAGRMRPGASDAAAWNTEVAKAIDAQRASLQAFWAAARAGTGGEGEATALADVLETACVRVLDRLYPFHI